MRKKHLFLRYRYLFLETATNSTETTTRSFIEMKLTPHVLPEFQKLVVLCGQSFKSWWFCVVKRTVADLYLHVQHLRFTTLPEKVITKICRTYPPKISFNKNWIGF